MTNYLVIDTETSGLPDYKLPADDPSQPRLASFSAIETDDTLEPLTVYDRLIQPDGWEISAEITAINGLTTDRCQAEGVPVSLVLAYYAEKINAGYVVVAYNAQFDCKILRGEMRRAGQDDLFELTRNICAMRSCDGLKIEKAGEKKGGFPKLSDAYRHFYNEEMPEHHTAPGDAAACLAIFQKLMKYGFAKEPAVHYAKNPPPGKDA